MKIAWYRAPEDDFWSCVDSMESPTRIYACTCPGAPDVHVDDCGTNGPGWMMTREAIGCMAMRSDRTRCKVAAISDAPLCELHMEKMASWVGQRYPDVFARMLSEAEGEYVHAIMRAVQAADTVAEIEAPKSRVYFFGIDDQIVKIGRSLRPETRLTQIRQGSGLMPAGHDRKRVELLGTIPGGARVEAQLHKLLRPHRLVGEWFSQHPDVVAVMAYLLAGEMEREARRVFVDSLTRPWWIDEGYIDEDAAVMDMEASA